MGVEPSLVFALPTRMIPYTYSSSSRFTPNRWGSGVRDSLCMKVNRAGESRTESRGLTTPNDAGQKMIAKVSIQAKKYYPKDLKDPKLTEKFKKVSAFRTILDKYVDVRDGTLVIVKALLLLKSTLQPVRNMLLTISQVLDGVLGRRLLSENTDNTVIMIMTLQEYYDALKSYCEAEEERLRAQRKEEEQRHLRHIAEREQRRQEWLRKVYEEEERRRAEEEEERRRISEYEEACRKAERERRRNEEWRHHGTARTTLDIILQTEDLVLLMNKRLGSTMFVRDRKQCRQGGTYRNADTLIQMGTQRQLPGLLQIMVMVTTIPMEGICLHCQDLDP
ncbi:uncharacterized protein FOMMEDRAFT_154117 [Fomitiporia mediterranea MF3/22]|uniref:uncharacterized protein n=1 Tax=Fomitiporia mediterranea (strain MF3/22) TaxID=694068 RepID=UPI0004409BF6|nr:uncharacterized protein FOMMEDRAFT_154117 [Fomitiporia mediterranea MF3/22]EJD04966.1 hypothetical protein FOMMEDRAFT_154117 [Fomitiporia mediterranea MF3/22]